MNEDEINAKNRNRGFERIRAEISRYEYKGFLLQEIKSDHLYEVKLIRKSPIYWTVHIIAVLLLIYLFPLLAIGWIFVIFLNFITQKEEIVKMWVESDGGLHIVKNGVTEIK